MMVRRAKRGIHCVAVRLGRMVLGRKIDVIEKKKMPMSDASRGQELSTPRHQHFSGAAP